jgi:uncharacterized protein YuzE
MAESLFIKVDEVGELLGISRAEAYRIIMNCIKRSSKTNLKRILGK